MYGTCTDIGGGADLNGTEYSLAHISLRWMIKELLIAPNAKVIWNEDDPRFAELGIVLHPTDSPSTVSVNNKRDSAGLESNTGRFQASSDDNALQPLLKSEYAEPDDAPSPYLPVNTREEDMLAPMHDALKTDPSWWPLEFLPFIIASQDPNDRWKNHIRYVLSAATHIHIWRTHPAFTLYSTIQHFRFIAPMTLRVFTLSSYIISLINRSNTFFYFLCPHQYLTCTRINLFRGRTIEPPPSPISSPNARDSHDSRGANISSAPTLWHVSVRDRMNASPAALHAAAKDRQTQDKLKKKSTRGSSWSWTWKIEKKQKTYVPRARLDGGGEPVFVR